MAKETDLHALAVTLYDIGAVQMGTFQLHSGRTSPIYLDLRILVSYPHALRQASAAYSTKLERLTFDLLAATPLAGLPIGTAVCLDMNKPLIYPRKTAKGYGTGKAIEGKWRAGQTAVMIDDLVTSGDSILQAAILLKDSGLGVSDAVVLIDREQGGENALREKGITLHAVMTLGQILAVLEDRERITAFQHAQVLKSLN